MGIPPVCVVSLSSIVQTAGSSQLCHMAVSKTVGAKTAAPWELMRAWLQVDRLVLKLYVVCVEGICSDLVTSLVVACFW